MKYQKLKSTSKKYSVEQSETQFFEKIYNEKALNKIEELFAAANQ